jgi:hypothetical protein
MFDLRLGENEFAPKKRHGLFILISFPKPVSKSINSLFAEFLKVPERVVFGTY